MEAKRCALWILTLFVVGCSEPHPSPKLLSESFNGSWRLSNVSAEKTGEISGKDKLLNAAQEKEVLQQGIVISFFRDGTFTQIRGSGDYKAGKWEFTDKEQTLYLINSTSADTISCSQEIRNEKQVMHLVNRSTGVTLTFIQFGLPLADFREDPFYIDNNVWRVKPLQKEEPDQLEERLANYFKHLAYVLKSSKERKLKAVSFEFSEGLAKIYNGGIGIQPLHVLPETWTNTYYNEADATSAYNMFKRYLETTSYKGASTGAWIDDDYDILLSIYGDINQGKFR